MSSRGWFTLKWVKLKSLPWPWLSPSNVVTQPSVLVEADADIAAQPQLDGEIRDPGGWNRIPRAPLRGLAQVADTLRKQAVPCAGR